jgi:iron complex outermembrane receptor protein
VKSGKKDFNNALNETADPKHRFTIKSSTTFWHKLDLDLTVRWVDSFKYNRSGEAETVDAYAEMDVRLAYQLSDNFEISLCGQNLLHDQHTEYVISNPNPRAEIERSVYGKVIWHF